MTYNIRDVIGFPPPNNAPVVTDWQSICDSVDMSLDRPVVYAFGGSSPIVTKMANGDQLAMSFRQNGRRLFVELAPYYWNPASPDWNGL